MVIALALPPSKVPRPIPSSSNRQGKDPRGFVNPATRRSEAKLRARTIKGRLRERGSAAVVWSAKIARSGLRRNLMHKLCVRAHFSRLVTSRSKVLIPLVEGPVELSSTRVILGSRELKRNRCSRSSRSWMTTPQRGGRYKG
jgi:hypothetical protein